MSFIINNKQINFDLSQNGTHYAVNYWIGYPYL
jgi:hypothetical protein